MPNYHKKITNPLTDQAFMEGMQQGHFVKNPQHLGFIALLHYSGVRVTEALRTIKSQFFIDNNILYYDPGVRLKHSKKTPALPLPLNAPYADFIMESLKGVKPDERVFPYCRKTGYNIVHRVFKYPHYHRLSRITWFFMPHPEIQRPQGFSIAEVRSWTGLSLRALDYYIGLANIQTMGTALSIKQPQ